MSALFTEEIIEPAPAPPAPEIPVVYYAGRGGYAIEFDRDYIPLSETAVGQHLRKAGVKKGAVSDLLCDIRTQNFVSYIGPVAGYQSGLHISEDSNRPFLVTTGPTLIEGAEGDWPFLRGFFAELFGNGEQHDAVMAWLRQARRNLIAGKRRPLPAAVLVGPRNCGKSLFGEVARLALGGRSAPAFAALSGLSSFNADIIGAELLTIDDEIASKDGRARTALAQGIKKHLFAANVRVEAKNKDALALRPVQAVVIAVNDEPEHLQVLPMLDDSVADKISLFACQRASLDGQDDRDTIAQLVREEMPALVHYLDQSDHPASLRDKRTGCAAWQHPDVVAALQSISPEEQMRELMQQCDAITEAVESGGGWRGSATELQRLLFENPVTGQAARSLLRYSSTCGTYLGRLQVSGRASMDRAMIHGVTRWTITSLNPPQAKQGRLTI
jgi:hypothetical protein